MIQSSPERSTLTDQVVDVETPEQVVFSYSVAGIGTRAAAAVVDMFIIFGATLLLFLLSLIAFLSLAQAGAERVERISEAWAMALLTILQFVLMWGYHVFFEGLRDGQTPGKRLMRIRVVRDGGFSVSLGEAAVRNLLRIVDMMPPVTYVVGMVSMLVTRGGKRLGDIVAGTIVVRERVMREHVDAFAAEPDQPSNVTAALSEPEFALLEQFLSRLAVLSGEARALLVQQLTARFAAHLPRGVNAEASLAELWEQERRARAAGLAARGAVGAARERHAILREGTPRWRRFAARLQRAQALGLRRMSEEEVSEFVAEYREVATDLARLRTASGGGASDALFHLSRLVAAGHNLLYRQPPISGRAILRYFTVTVPGEIRRSSAAILTAAALLFVPLGITYFAILADPSLAGQILPQGMFDRAEEGLRRAEAREGYIVVAPAERPLLAAAVMTNNLRVTYNAFALGMTAGIGTVLILVYNGVSFGAAIGLYSTMGITPLIMDFVIPHGVFELTAVSLGGGAGLLLARALLLPGALDRRSALRAYGVRALHLVVAASIFLVFAGLIEGLISPRPELPAWFRYGVAGLSAVIIIGFIALGRGTNDPRTAEATATSAP